MKKKFIFAFVLIFFLITRIYKISQLPASVYWDEASIGYNAYAIGTDLKDEWGKFLPIHFRAFGEFKLPVYIYSVVPFVKILGLNAFSVRLPAVLYSLGTLTIVYFLMRKITGRVGVAILSTFILTVSPWFFIFSRTGYEASAGVFFTLLAAYLFLYSSRKNIFFFFGTLSIIASLYSYTSFRIISSLLLFIFLFLFIKKDFKKRILISTISIVIYLVSLVPIARLFIYDAGFGRAQSFALIPGIQQVYDLKGKPHLQITFNRTGGINWWQNVGTIGFNYLSHFSPNFLFLNGDSNPRSQIPGHGELYWIDLPLVLIGIFTAIKKRKLYLLPLIFLLLAPIPASLTKESPHALRTLLAAPAYAMLAGFGGGYLTETFKKHSLLILIVIVAGYYLSFEPYAVDFVTKYQAETASDWQFQYKEIFANQNNGKVTDKYGQPYIFALFYQKIPPAEFRSTVKYNPVNNWGFSTVQSFNGFVFSDK